jgi:hypothetical protein
MRSASAERPPARRSNRWAVIENRPAAATPITVMIFGEICRPLRGRIDCRSEIDPKSDRLLVARFNQIERI